MRSQLYTEDQLILQPSNRLFDELAAMLNEASLVYTPPPEKTLFSVGGRGYYENPTSDLLAFFMDPSANHGLGNLFLSAFLECLGASELRLRPLESVTINREVTFKEGRIDLVVQGADWCLIIENKIYHSPVNPFELYEEYANTLPRRTKRFAILSPGGASERGNWTGVSYKKYFEIVGQRLSVFFLNNPFSKWLLFAREFISHIQNLLYQSPMNDSQLQFIEENLGKIAKMKELEQQYQLHVRAALKEILGSRINGHDFSVTPESWEGDAFVFRCKSPHWGGENDMVLMVWVPPGGRTKFGIQVYLEDKGEPRLSKATGLFNQPPDGIEGKYYRWAFRDCGSREAAFEKVVELAQSLTEVLEST